MSMLGSIFDGTAATARSAFRLYFEPLRLLARFVADPTSVRNKNHLSRLFPTHESEWASTSTGETGVSQERRLLTVVMIDIVGFSSQAAHEVEVLLASFHNLATPLLRVTGAMAIVSAGDGLIAIFATPDQAVEFATTFQQQAKIAGLPAKFRAGIATGEMWMRRENMPVGYALNLASRLSSYAEAGSILLDAATVTLLRGHRPAEFAESRVFDTKGQGRLEAYVLRHGGFEDA